MQCVQYWLGKGVRQLSTSTLPFFSTVICTKTDPDPDSRSMNEVAEVAERIISNLNAVFEKDDALDEFDIVPQESQANRSPVIHRQHKLGLESWCTGFVYSHSFRNFIFLRPQKSIQANSKPQSTIPVKTNIDYSQLTEAEKWNKCLELTRLILLLNPDVTTAWNFRREAFINGYCSLQDEFQLVTLVCSRKPKCSEAFYYRKWLVKETLKRGGIGREYSLWFFQREVKAALQAASKYLSNYHAWDYRRFILETWLTSDDLPKELKAVILNSEKDVSDTWLNTHISDYCGYHYRQKLLTYLLKFQLSLDDSKDFLSGELKENRGMLLFYPGHESLWYHRKFLIKQYTSLLDKLENNFIQLIENEQSLVEGILPKPSTSIEGELLNSVEGINSDLPISDCTRLNHMYSERYLKWLKASF